MPHILPTENNFTIDPTFIASLPKDNPLFVAEFNPHLKKNFENPRLMREFGLIQENLDGFGDLANKFTMRGVPPTLGLRNTVNSAQGPRTGWSGDGAPGDGSLPILCHRRRDSALYQDLESHSGRRLPPSHAGRTRCAGGLSAFSGPAKGTRIAAAFEGAVAFYDGESFNNSQAGKLLRQATGSGIEIDGTQVVAIAAFLRVINALENIRQSIELLEPVAHKASRSEEQIKRLVGQAAQETQDSIRVLSGGGLHPQAVQH